MPPARNDGPQPSDNGSTDSGSSDGLAGPIADSIPDDEIPSDELANDELASDEGDVADRLASPPQTGANVPALEPPARLSCRFSSKKRSVRSLRELLRATPSWLASLTIHLAVLLLFGSLVVPVQLKGRSFEIVLLLTDLDSPTSEGDLVLIKSTPLDTNSKVDRGQEGASAESVDRKESPVQEPIEEPQKPDEEPKPIGGAKEPETEMNSAPNFDLGVEIPSVLVSVFAPMREDRIDVGEAPRAIPMPPGLDERDKHDEVVDQFIEYDIGRLKGAAGESALRDFDKLNHESIPALVRGLNKSAGIRASCPVVVISQMLENQLRSSSDPVMIRYALDNLNKNVDLKAPHRNRLENLRKRLAAHFNDVENDIKKIATAFGVPMTKDLLKRVGDCSSLTQSQLRMAVASSDPRERVAALLAATLRRQNVDFPSRHQLSMVIAEQMESESNPQMLNLQNRALWALSTKRIDPSTGSGSVLTRTPTQWKDELREQRLAVRTREANNLLAKASRRKGDGKSIEAGEILRQIINSYMDTPAAETAQNELGTIDFDRIAAAQFNRASSLEAKGNRTAAIRYFQEIMIKYPETSAASAAKRRIDEIRSGE